MYRPAAGGANYIYDGDGNRVEKSGSKIYWFAGSEILDETDATGSVTNSSFNEYFFFGGNRIARRDSSGNVFYYLTDQLGTSRKILQAGQTTACYDADFEPFGWVPHSFAHFANEWVPVNVMVSQGGWIASWIPCSPLAHFASVTDARHLHQ